MPKKGVWLQARVHQFVCIDGTLNKLIVDKSGVGIGQMIHFSSSSSFIYNCRRGVRFAILVHHLDTWTQSVKIIQDKIMGISPRTWHRAGEAWNDQSSEQKLPAEDEQPETFRAPASDPERQIGGKNIKQVVWLRSQDPRVHPYPWNLEARQKLALGIVILCDFQSCQLETKTNMMTVRDYSNWGAWETW